MSSEGVASACGSDAIPLRGFGRGAHGHGLGMGMLMRVSLAREGVGWLVFCLGLACGLGDLGARRECVGGMGGWVEN